MGEVYAAYDPELDRKVAIKILRRELESENAHRLQQREAKAMARLSHPNVVEVYDFGRLSRQPFIAMEYVDGQTLSEWLAAYAERGLREILRSLPAGGTRAGGGPLRRPGPSRLQAHERDGDRGRPGASDGLWSRRPRLAPTRLGRPGLGIASSRDRHDRSRPADGHPCLPRPGEDRRLPGRRPQRSVQLLRRALQSALRRASLRRFRCPFLSRQGSPARGGGSQRLAGARLAPEGIAARAGP